MIQHCTDGSTMSWKSPRLHGQGHMVSTGLTIPIVVSVTPFRPGHVVTVEYRINGGPVASVPALPEEGDEQSSKRIFQAVLPCSLIGFVEFLPVLRFGNNTLSCLLLDSTTCSAFTALPSHQLTPPTSDRTGQRLNHAPPPWSWSYHLLGTVRVYLKEQKIGIMPDGLRINWLIEGGSFVGAGLEAQICPGGADWMRIRCDGIGLVDVNATFKTSSGAVIYANYGGMLDLGPDGYNRALHNEFDPLPPLVVAPTYCTADKQLAWVNRLQCIGVGRVDMQALEVCFDVYHFEIGNRLTNRSHV
jgi:hypothetical protein